MLLPSICTPSCSVMVAVEFFTSSFTGSASTSATQPCSGEMMKLSTSLGTPAASAVLLSSACAMR